jgi:DNA-binding transcriptional MerR regulator
MPRFPTKRVGAVARESECSESLIRYYADRGLLPFERDSGGARLFYDDAAEVVRRLRKDRSQAAPAA